MPWAKITLAGNHCSSGFSLMKCRDNGSLVGVLSPCKHICLQFRKVARLVTALTNPHVQQVGVYGCVISLQQSTLNGLSCGDKHRHDTS